MRVEGRSANEDRNMQDRPTIDELLTAVQSFLEREIVPRLDGRLQFHARVAANILAIVRRELQLQPELTLKEWHRLAALLSKQRQEPPAAPEGVAQEVRAWTEELCAWIRSAPMETLLASEALWRHLELTTKEKLAVANPRLLSSE
ncbi:hypothetical protein HRbin30_02744 [bacterium HR30]|nr:hypothetical protein HRbin30_02744 [bacterium HR30]